MAQVPIVSYALDIGVYNVGARGQMLTSTTAAWCRVPEGSARLDAVTRERGIDDGTLVSLDGTSRYRAGRSIPRLARAIATDLRAGHAVALGLEAPMWIPLTERHRARLKLFRPRFEVEAGAEWYLQSGAAATLKAISLGRLLRAELGSLLGNQFPLLTTDHGVTERALVLYEGFVVGDYKALGIAVPDEVDALVAALAWGSIRRDFELPQTLRAVSVHEAGSRSDPVMSIWDFVWDGLPVTGPRDCDVVALRRA